MSQLHPYAVSVEWSGGRDGSGQVRGDASGAVNAIGVPVEFGGAGGGTNPEELLAAAVAACYTMTFGIIAVNRKLPLRQVSASAVGHVEQNGAQFSYKSVAIRPKIVLEPSATDEQAKLAEEMAHKADLYCIITNAIRDKVEVVVEPTIVRE